MSTVYFSNAQRSWTNGEDQVVIDVKRMDALVLELYRRYPGLDGKLEGMSVSVDGVIHRDALYLSIEPEAEIHFLGAIAGGSGASSLARSAAGSRRSVIQ